MRRIEVGALLNLFTRIIITKSQAEESTTLKPSAPAFDSRPLDVDARADIKPPLYHQSSKPHIKNTLTGLPFFHLRICEFYCTRLLATSIKKSERGPGLGGSVRKPVLYSRKAISTQTSHTDLVCAMNVSL